MNDRGLKTVQHGGGAPGFSTQTIYYPDHGLTIVVLANFGGFDAPGFARKIAAVCLGDACSCLSATERCAGRAVLARAAASK